MGYNWAKTKMKRLLLTWYWLFSLPLCLHKTLLLVTDVTEVDQFVFKHQETALHAKAREL